MRFLVFLASIAMAFQGFSQVEFLKHTHSHNNYNNKEPLVDALNHGFASVEVDVHLIGHRLYVSHDKPEQLSDSLLLENLYLKPLFERVKQNNGSVYPGYGAPLLLMIDFKTNADSTYKWLRNALEPYRSMLCTNAELTGCPIKVFVSGNRPLDEILADEDGFIALDGRPGDLGKGISPTTMPVISENYKKINSISENFHLNTKEGLMFLVIKAHNEGKKVRLWNAPDNEASWKFLLEHGVDLINTDKIEELAEFLRSKYHTPSFISH